MCLDGCNCQCTKSKQTTGTNSWNSIEMKHCCRSKRAQVVQILKQQQLSNNYVVKLFFRFNQWRTFFFLSFFLCQPAPIHFSLHKSNNRLLHAATPQLPLYASTITMLGGGWQTRQPGSQSVNQACKRFYTAVPGGGMGWGRVAHTCNMWLKIWKYLQQRFSGATRRDATWPDMTV